jgi:hypothetical protein
VSDSDLLRRNRSNSGKSDDIRAEEEIKRLVRAVEGLVNREEKRVILTEDERRFLADIARNPISGVVGRYTRIGINRYQGNLLQQRLLNKKLISWKPVSKGKGRLKVLVLTDEGKKAIPDVKVEKVLHKSSSWEHEYWKFRVADHYRKKGYEVTFEYKIGDGKSVDLVAEKNGKKIAIEIETGKSDAVYNIRKDLEAGFDEVVVFCIDKKIINQIRSKLRSIYPELPSNLKILHVFELSSRVIDQMIFCSSPNSKPHQVSHTKLSSRDPRRRNILPAL